MCLSSPFTPLESPPHLGPGRIRGFGWQSDASRGKKLGKNEGLRLPPRRGEKAQTSTQLQLQAESKPVSTTMASPVAHVVHEPGDTEPYDWPGERNPSQWDVHDAHQIPEVSFLQRFKAAVLLSEDATDCTQYLPRLASTSQDLDSTALVRCFQIPWSGRGALTSCT